MARCLREGLLESPLMPLDESVSIMETMDAVLALSGIDRRRGRVSKKTKKIFNYVVWSFLSFLFRGLEGG